jgi:tetratricopeptide (TPR) repeat protein
MKRQNILLLSLFFMAMLSFFFSGCSTKEKEMPITTSSDEAEQLFINARNDIENAEFEKGKKLLDEALQKDSTFALAYFYLAISEPNDSVAKRNFDKAIALSENMPEGERLFIKMGKTFYIDGDKKLGDEYLDKLVKMFPEDPGILFTKGRNFYYDDQIDSAIIYLKKVIVLDPAYALAYNPLGYAYMKQNNFSEAEKEFKEYMRLAPDRPNPYDSYGEFLLKIGKYDESIANYQKAFNMDNEFNTALYGIGDNYVFKGDYNKAREYYQKYFDNAKTVTAKINALNRIARSYLYENKLAEALKSFDNVIAFTEKEKKAKDNLMANLSQSLALSEFGKTAEGLKKIQEDIKLIDKIGLTDKDKDHFNILSNLYMAYAYAMNNDLNKAKAEAEIYQKAVEKTDDTSLKEMGDWISGFIDFKEGDYKSMIEKFNKLSKSDAQDKYYLAMAYLKTGNKEAADKLFNEILNSNDNTIQLAIVWKKVKSELKK